MNQGRRPDTNKKKNTVSKHAGRPNAYGNSYNKPYSARSKVNSGSSARPASKPSAKSGYPQKRTPSKQPGSDRLRNLKPKDYNDGYYINEYGEIKQFSQKSNKGKSAQRQKNTKVRSPRIRKIRKIITYALIFLAVLSIGVFLSLTVFFKTQYIKVNGETRYDSNDIIAACGIKVEDNIFLADKEKASNDIINKFPYILETKVSFKIPDIINIEVTEAEPSYGIQIGDSYLLISSKGRILENTKLMTKNIPLLKGPSLTTTNEGEYVTFENEKVISILTEIITSVESNEFNNIKSIDVSNLAKITLDFDNRIKINLGMPEDIDYKIRTAIKIIFEKLDPNNTGIIQGDLDVSRCNVSNGRSVFNEKTIDVAGQAENSSSPSTEETTNLSQINGGVYNDDTYGNYND